MMMMMMMMMMIAMMVMMTAMMMMAMSDCRRLGGCQALQGSRPCVVKMGVEFKDECRNVLLMHTQQWLA
jgi:hypothetical protein